MKRARGVVSPFLLVLVLMGMVMVGPGWAQAKPELTVALSSFSTEVLDPVLGGHIVKYYLSMMFDYLVGTTPDGQPSRDGGLANRWENSSDYKRWTFHLRKGVKFHNGDERDLGGREVQHHAGHRQAVDHRLRGAAAHPDPGHRDAGARPGGDRHQGADPDHPDVSLALPLHRGHDPAEEVHRGHRRRRVRPQAGGQRALQVRGAGHRLAHPAGRDGQPLADRDAQVQDHTCSAWCPRRRPALRCCAGARWTWPT